MPATWKQLTIVPSDEALNELRQQWGWLVDDSLEAFMASASGDVFFEAPDRSIQWLDTGQGLLTRIAENRDEFLLKLREDPGAEWLLAPVVDKLLESGVSLAPGQCFGFKTLPILGGRYDPENMAAMSASSWYGFSGYLHQQLKNLPDGTNISLKFDP